jgi:hypothetical protein
MGRKIEEWTDDCVITVVFVMAFILLSPVVVLFHVFSFIRACVKYVGRMVNAKKKD